MFGTTKTIQELTARNNELERKLQDIRHLVKKRGDLNLDISGMLDTRRILRSEINSLEDKIDSLFQQIRDLKVLKWEQKCAIHQEVEALTRQGKVGSEIKE